MAKFNRAKKKLSNEPAGLAEFAKGANKRALLSDEPEPWKAFDPQANPTKGINLRLNEYELALIQYVADKQDRSAQKTIKRLLIPALEKEAGKEK